MKNSDKILAWAVELQAIAQTGLYYCENKFDIERIVHEELHKNPDGGFVEIGVIAKRRCMNEL